MGQAALAAVEMAVLQMVELDLLVPPIPAAVVEAEAVGREELVVQAVLAS